MKRFALIGEPLGHSLSPVLHKCIYRQLEIDDASYRPVEIPEERLNSFFAGFRVGGFDGVNVTIPHKANVISLLDEVDSKAKLINAVNCVNRTNNKLIGYNTDMLGFAYSLRNSGTAIEDSEFLVLGAGGSAMAVGAVLAEGEAKTVHICNRSEENARQLEKTILAINGDVRVNLIDCGSLVDIAKDVNCVVNTTPIGMSPSTQESPINVEFFQDHMLAFDLIYNPAQTLFLRDAHAAGAATINGMEMLVAQAVYSVEIWMGGNIIAHIDMNALVRDLEKAIK